MNHRKFQVTSYRHLQDLGTQSSLAHMDIHVWFSFFKFMDEFFGIEFCLLIPFREWYQHTDPAVAHTAFCSGKIRGDLRIRSLDQTHTHLPLSRALLQGQQAAHAGKNARQKYQDWPLIKLCPCTAGLQKKLKPCFPKYPHCSSGCTVSLQASRTITLPSSDIFIAE